MAANLIIDSMVLEAKRADALRSAERTRRAAEAGAPRRPGFLPALRRAVVGLAAAGLLSLSLAGGAAADEGHEGLDDCADAYAGNGGVAVSDTGGGAVLLGDVNGGGNAGAGVVVGDVADGSVAIDRGEVDTETGLGVAADGGVGIADASGGDGNVAIGIDRDGHDRDRDHDGRFCD